MKTEKITQKELSELGLNDLESRIAFGKVAHNIIKGALIEKSQVIHDFKNIIESPESYLIEGNPYNELAVFVKEKQATGTLVKQKIDTYDLKEHPLPFPVYGKEIIDEGALKQMETAMKLPVAIAGALMPVAHIGFGLPIGGVLATRNDIVILFAVGSDIACRMCMTIYPLNESLFPEKRYELLRALVEQTYFGVGSDNKKHLDTSVFDKPEWSSSGVIRHLMNTAYRQFGTSGAGNHFVEWGILEVIEFDDLLQIPVGNYIALLSHSGSRGFGNAIATTYAKIAMDKTKLPDVAKRLAWLDLNTDEGKEYWTAMNLAGEYASANHHEIHNKISKAIGIDYLKMVENHHNFAWKEKLSDGTDVIIHRKGATPAGVDNIGIIPGSMTLPGFIVRGKGNASSLNSASHGAGRCMSRAQAFQNINRKDIKDALKNADVKLIGGDIDEAPQAYKDIAKVMKQQQELVQVIAKFTPRLVRMADPESWIKNRKKSKVTE